MKAPEAVVDSPQQVELLLQRAWEIRHEDTRAALQLNQAAHAMALRIGHASGVAYGLMRIALCGLILADDLDATRAQLQQAAAQLAGLGDAKGEVEALNLLAHVHVRANQSGQAIELYTRCLDLRRRLGDREGESTALNNLAWALRQTHRHADALELLFASLALGEAIGDAACCAYALNNIAGVLLDTGDPQGAIDHCERALALTLASRDRALECSTRIALGKAMAALGREPLALAQLRQAVALARRTGNRDDLVEALAASGDALQQFGQLDEAAVLLDEALRLQPTSGAHVLDCTLLCALGRNQRLRGDRQAALALLERALQAALATGSDAGAGQAHRLLAATHEEGGNPAAALEHFRRFHEADQRIDGREMRRRIRAVLTRAELAQARREAQEQRRLASDLAQALDAERQSVRVEPDRLVLECERARRFGRALSVAWIDVDDLGAINQGLSRATGDAALRQVALLLNGACGAGDVVGRQGGDEFLWILVETPLDDATMRCEQLCETLSSFDWRSLHPDLARVTVSIGLAGADRLPDASSLSANAERALRLAKQAGKQRVCR